VKSHTKFGPDEFSRYDVYWIQTDRQTVKESIYIDIDDKFIVLLSLQADVGDLQYLKL